MEKDLEFSIFTEKYETVHQVIDRGLNADLIRNNPAFMRAINDLYQKYTLQEDSLIGNPERSNRDKNADQRHFAMMRALLVDLVMHLDMYIENARALQAQQELENQNMEIPYNGYTS